MDISYVKYWKNSREPDVILASMTSIVILQDANALCGETRIEGSRKSCQDSDEKIELEKISFSERSLHAIEQWRGIMHFQAKVRWAGLTC